LATVGTEIKDLVASALKKVANIDRRYENGDIEEKRIILGSMFPDFLEFDGTKHRTPRLNSAIALIYQSNNKLQSQKKRDKSLFF
jgi:site-specific DNA recombinase